MMLRSGTSMTMPHHVLTAEVSWHRPEPMQHQGDHERGAIRARKPRDDPGVVCWCGYTYGERGKKNNLKNALPTIRSNDVLDAALKSPASPWPLTAVVRMKQPSAENRDRSANKCLVVVCFGICLFISMAHIGSRIAMVSKRAL